MLAAPIIGKSRRPGLGSEKLLWSGALGGCSRRLAARPRNSWSTPAGGDG